MIVTKCGVLNKVKLKVENRSDVVSLPRLSETEEERAEIQANSM